MSAGKVTAVLGVLGALWDGYQKLKAERAARRKKAALAKAERTKSDLERILAEAHKQQGKR